MPVLERQAARAMHRKYYIVFPVIAIVAAAGVYLKYKDRLQSEPRSDRIRETASVRAAKPSDMSIANLYFANKDNVHLIAETRSLLHTGGPAAFGKRIIENLVKGPQEDLVRTIPGDTRLLALYVLEDGTACVDLSEMIAERHPGGSRSELLTVFSIVNSLVLNLPEVTAVKLLVAGREASTLAGHIDIRFPFKANMLLVR